MIPISSSDPFIKDFLERKLEAPCNGAIYPFYPPKWKKEKFREREKREKKAKSICISCEFAKPCLETALFQEAQYEARVAGVWGGMGELDRKRILKARES